MPNIPLETYIFLIVMFGALCALIAAMIWAVTKSDKE